MSGGGRDAETKFWRTPELVKSLLPFLSAYSIERLAECHDVTRDLLQSTDIWNKFIKRSISETMRDSTNLSLEGVEDEDVEEVEEEIHRQEMLEIVGELAIILRMFEDANLLLLDLLHLICEKFPPNMVSSDDNRYELVDVACSCNATHSVSPLGFLILDEVETTLGSTEQSVQKVQISGLDRWLGMPALIHRIVRQQEMVLVARVGVFSIWNKETAEAFYALAQNCLTLHFPTLWIAHQIGADGWATIRKAIQHLGRMVPRYHIMSTKKAMVGGRREDLRAIWDGLGLWSSWCLLEGDHGPGLTRLENWEMLEVILDTVEEEGKEEEQVSEEHEAAGGPDQEGNSSQVLPPTCFWRWLKSGRDPV